MAECPKISLLRAEPLFQFHDMKKTLISHIIIVYQNTSRDLLCFSDCLGLYKIEPASYFSLAEREQLFTS